MAVTTDTHDGEESDTETQAPPSLPCTVDLDGGPTAEVRQSPTTDSIHVHVGAGREPNVTAFVTTVTGATARGKRVRLAGGGSLWCRTESGAERLARAIDWHAPADP